MKSKRLCYACDLKDDPILIAQYKKYHQAIWPEIKKSIIDAGILNMEIYLCQNRLFMIMDVASNFDAEIKKKMDNENPKVQDWEALMWNYQQALPKADKNEKWILMECIYSLVS